MSHGSPTLSIDETIPARKFLQSWKQNGFPQKPNSILTISTHWEASVPIFNSIVGLNDTIYYFYSFPNSLYKLKYPAPRSP
ncbi:putative stizolobate synthase [Rosa chinensis]|uniref:Putative stizolobate synthase n=1 Tax=Rosa chinensis TaxID=74649 RepID=A0A2P6PMR9_ROSCH|nr:putative stizolobate synthase [Rosa chinensis]